MKIKDIINNVMKKRYNIKEHEPFYYTNFIKGITLEILVLNYLKKYLNISFKQNEPRGINTPNVDFNIGDILLECKNFMRPITVTDILFKVLIPKFINVDPFHRKTWVLLCPEVTPKGKKLCKNLGIQLINFNKQTVPEEIWEKYPEKKKKKSTTKHNQLINALHKFFKEKNQKKEEGSFHVFFIILNYLYYFFKLYIRISTNVSRIDVSSSFYANLEGYFDSQ
jgi:hypothetical protein